jgi:hypothetical protein
MRLQIGLSYLRRGWYNSGEYITKGVYFMVSTAVSVAIIIAIIGWLATIFAISRSSLSRAWKRNLLIPYWIPWLALALGAPILSGLIPLNDAFGIGGAMTTGMLVSIVFGRRQSSR